MFLSQNINCYHLFIQGMTQELTFLRESKSTVKNLKNFGFS